jgi:hypothetical protein
MAKQLEVVKFRDLIPVSSIGFAKGFNELTLDVTGEDFSSVEKVTVNDIPCPEFIILNKNRLYAQLPDGAKNQISSIEVVSSSFTKTAVASKISYAFGNKTKTVSGIIKLVQLFTKWMLQSPGSDIFNPERGGGLQELVGQIPTSKKMDQVLGALTMVVQNTSTQIRSVQLMYSNLPMDERLLSAELVDVNVYEKEMEARIKVAITSVAGRDAIASLAL